MPAENDSTNKSLEFVIPPGAKVKDRLKGTPQICACYPSFILTRMEAKRTRSGFHQRT